MNRLLRYAAIGSLALIIGGASVQARASASSAPAGDPWKSDELSAKKDGRGGGGGEHGGGGGKHRRRRQALAAAAASIMAAASILAAAASITSAGPASIHGDGTMATSHVNRNVRWAVRPVRVWSRRPYYGQVIGGVALGTIIAAGVIGSAPAGSGAEHVLVLGRSQPDAAAIGIIASPRNRSASIDPRQGRARHRARPCSF